MKKLTLALALALALTSCQYKDLCYDHHHTEKPNFLLRLTLKLELDVDLDVTEEAHTKITMPTYMKVCLYDPLSGTLNKTDFVGPTGGPLQVTPGKYNMIVYSFGTEWTWIRGEDDVKTLEAYTSDITEMKAPQFAKFARANSPEAPGPIIYTPDHLLVTKKEIEIPEYGTEDLVITIEATAATIVETYEIEAPNVTGVENIASAEAFVTNQARSSFFGRGEKNTEPATIYFPVEVDREKGILVTTFNTFGKLPGESECFLHILLIDSEGNSYTISEDVTDMFDNTDHIIEVNDSIDIPKPEGGGGIAPTVDEWEEINQDVPIG